MGLVRDKTCVESELNSGLEGARIILILLENNNNYFCGRPHFTYYFL